MPPTDRPIVHRASRLALIADQPDGPAPTPCENFRSSPGGSRRAGAHTARPSCQGAARALARAMLHHGAGATTGSDALGRRPAARRRDTARPRGPTRIERVDERKVPMRNYHSLGAAGLAVIAGIGCAA